MKIARIALTLIAGVALAPSASCGDDCRDLVRSAVHVTLYDIDDPSQIRVTVTSTDGTVLTDASLEELGELDAGSYDLTFRLDAPGLTAISHVNGVCTVGQLTGCDAEDQPAAGTPHVDLTLNGTALVGELSSNGACP